MSALLDLTDPGSIRDAIPPDFADDVAERSPEGGPSGADWLMRLPGLVREAADEWEAAADGPVRSGQCAVVFPVRTPRGPAVVKVGWPHVESEHEHLALRAWNGDGAVRLLAADPARGALLLERLDAEHTTALLDVDDSSAVIGALLRRLDRPALPQLQRMSALSRGWADRLRSDGTSVLPPRLVDRAAGLAEQLGAQDGADARLVHTDLHDANVLGAGREPWLAIDPKPLAAVPEFAVAPLVWNRAEEAVAAPSTRDHLRRRVRIACAAGGLDEDRARDWTLVRCALNALWLGEDGPVTGHDEADAEVRRAISHQVTICKAMTE